MLKNNEQKLKIVSLCCASALFTTYVIPTVKFLNRNGTHKSMVYLV